MERIQELLARLSDLSDAEVAELEGLILTEFDSAEGEDVSPDSVERMVSLADALDGVRGEVGRRTEQAEALAQKASDASARVHAKDAVEGETEDQPDEADLAAGKKPDEEEEAPPAGEVPPEVTDVIEEVPPPADAAVPPPPPPPPGGEAPAEGEEDDEEERKKKAAASADGVEDTAAETEPEAEAAVSTEATDAPTEPVAELSDAAPAEAELSATDEPQENSMANENGTGVVVTPPAAAAPVPSDSALSGEGVTLTITAGADIPGVGTGAELTNMDDLADAFAKRLHTLRNANGGSAQQHVVASMTFGYPESRQLHGDNADNIRKVNEVILAGGNKGKALTAAAGICAPLEIIYDMDICGVSDRPVKDALARFNADRGGVKIYRQPTLATGTGPTTPANWPDASPKRGAGTGIWTSGLGGSPAPVAKTCAEAQCPPANEIYLEAVYSCVCFSNFTNRFFPEVVKANTDLALIQHARVAELNLIQKIQALSIVATPKAIPNMGFTRVLIRTLLDAAAYLRRVHRLADNAPMRTILPNWVQDAVNADISQQMPGDGLESLNPSSLTVNSIFSNRGIKVTWALDDWDNVGAPAAAPASTGPTVGQGFKNKVSFPLFPEGSFLFLDGGTLDLGVQRDGSMISANEYCTFMETFENVAQVGCGSLWVKDLDVCLSGAAAALVPGVC
jgi:hypothetical protein